MKTQLLAVSLLALGALPVVAAPAKKSPVPRPEQVASAPLQADNLVLTPVKTSADDTQKMLDIHLWKFSLRAPKNTEKLAYSLQLRQPDKEPVVIYSSEIVPLIDGEWAFGLMPSNGASLVEADNLKTYIRPGQSFNGWNRIVPNPLKQFKLSSQMMSASLHLSPQGDAVLMEFSNGADFAPPKSQLVLVLHAVKKFTLKRWTPSNPPSPGDNPLVHLLKSKSR